MYLTFTKTFQWTSPSGVHIEFRAALNWKRTHVLAIEIINKDIFQQQGIPLQHFNDQLFKFATEKLSRGRHITGRKRKHGTH